MKIKEVTINEEQPHKAKIENGGPMPVEIDFYVKRGTVVLPEGYAPLYGNFQKIIDQYPACVLGVPA